MLRDDIEFKNSECCIRSMKLHFVLVTAAPKSIRIIQCLLNVIDIKWLLTWTESSGPSLYTSFPIFPSPPLLPFPHLPFYPFLTSSSKSSSPPLCTLNSSTLFSYTPLIPSHTSPIVPPFLYIRTLNNLSSRTAYRLLPRLWRREKKGAGRFRKEVGRTTVRRQDPESEVWGPRFPSSMPGKLDQPNHSEEFRDTANFVLSSLPSPFQPSHPNRWNK
ncbi:hypothetical protein Fcan01_22404 [Folsomia candida]|uniref:Uncharacterized protein n=1 Tax=Folsomia candida TaxID=158441 RepID=A0A226DE98_FOLCA|nr:hypothetical protein Fcan01_22404 [Folsomia candida]